MSFEFLILKTIYFGTKPIFCITDIRQGISLLLFKRASFFHARCHDRKISCSLLSFPQLLLSNFNYQMTILELYAIKLGQSISIQQYRQFNLDTSFMAYPPQSNWGLFTNPEQARLQAEIQSQTAALLSERNKFRNPVQQQNQNWQQSYKPSIQRASHKQTVKNTGNSKIISKMQQLISLCQNQNDSSSNQLTNVVNAQKQILQLLLQKNGKAQTNLQTTYQINPVKVNINETTENQQTSQQQNYQFRSNIRQKLQTNPKLTLSDDLIGMIEQIQRKALTQIQKLRQQKISLMKQLKVQISQNNNLQRQIINYGSTRQQHSRNQTPFKQYRQSDFNSNAEVSNNQNLQQFKNYIVYLQSELQKKDSIIRQQVTTQSSNGSGHIMQLLEQGEHIRKNTIHLIRLKEGQTNGARFQANSNNQYIHRIKELQDLLQKQEDQKANFLNDLIAFKKKYQSLQQENKDLKRQSKTIGTLGTSYNETKLYSGSPKNDFRGGNSGLDQYQKVLSRMRKARN